MPRRVVVLGAGISGLAYIWNLKKKFGSDVIITILEKSARVGGWIQTTYQDGFLFEQGPRSCRSKGSGIYTLRLIEELGLQDQVIVGDPAAAFRYLYRSGRLERLPHSVTSLLFSSWLKPALSAFWKDWRTPPGQNLDESIQEFIVRRLSQQFAAELVDPLVSGIYAGNIQQLSVRACFPHLHQWEQQSGSLIKGAWKSKKRKSEPSPFIKEIQRSSLFTFQNGMETLPLALAKHLEADIRLNCEVVHLESSNKEMILTLSTGAKVEADQVVSALPLTSLAKILKPLDHPFLNLPYASVTVVNLGYSSQILKQSGFGYLIPSKEQEQILGCVWDSCAFPNQNVGPQTRLTVMMGGTRNPRVALLSDSECLSIALESLQKHMNIEVAPQTFLIKRANEAIPQYIVGYDTWREQFRKMVSVHYPQLQLLGCAFNGVSVNDCISQAYVLSQ